MLAAGDACCQRGSRLQIFLGLAVEHMGGRAAERERDLAADRERSRVFQLGRLDDDDGVAAARIDMHMHGAAHHFADLDLTGDHIFRRAGEQQMLGAHAQRDRAGLYVVLFEVCLLDVREHDMRLVMKICEKLVVLEHGNVIAKGDPETVKSNPDVIEAYLGTDDGDDEEY